MTTKTCAILRLVVLIALLFALFAATRVGAGEHWTEVGEFSVTGTECPPEDVGGWYFDPFKPTAPRFNVIELERDDFEVKCPEKRIGFPPLACTWIFPRPDAPNVGVIYIKGTLNTARNGLLRHEVCHLVGWSHPE